MAFKKNITHCSTFLLIIITFQSIFCASTTAKKLWGLKHKGTIKTIESDDGEMIDCVDIYKQPAFDHPKIKKLKMNPTSYPIGMEMKLKSNQKLIQDWHKYGECPEGTIPIRRTTSSINHTKSTSFTMSQFESNHSTKFSSSSGHEYAMVTDKGSSYYGAQVWLNVWNPKVEYGELSASKMWLVGAKSQDFNEEYNSIEAGWIVYPSRYKDSKTRFYISWTGEGANNTGCYDLDCQGFVQTNRKYAIGASITPVSSYNGSQFELPVTIFKDTRTGDWWLQLSGTNMGYWPNSLFTVLSDHANIVNWGGEILNDRSEGHHTTTQMGSGHFPTEGYKKSAFMTVLRVTDSNYAQRNPGFLNYTLTSLGCYDVKIVDRESGGHAVSFGGPGFSSSCF